MLTSTRPAYDDAPLKTVELDAERMRVTENGVEGYFWPVSNRVREDFYEALLAECHKLFKQYDPKNPELLPYKLWCKQLICETVGVFWGDLLREGFNKSGVQPLVPDYYRLWSAQFNGKMPEDNPVLKNLYRTPPAKKSAVAQFKNIFEKIKRISSRLAIGTGGLHVDGMRVTAITDAVLDTAVIVTQRTPLLRAQVQANPDDYVFCRSDRWYSPILPERTETLMQRNFEDFEIRYMDIVSTLYAKNRIPFSDESRAYVQRFMSLAVALIREHFARLENKKVPKRIWTGSGGNIWDTMLRIKSMERGGYAVGHDHGAGLAHVDNPYMGLLEFWGCSRFVGFNDNQAKCLVKDQSVLIKLDGTLPEITGKSANAPKDTVTKYPKFNTAKQSPKNIIIMADIYDGDRGRGGPYAPDIMYADWQARLTGKLNGWGYTPIIKIHPESKIHPPEGLSSTLGAKIESTKIEDMLDQIDLVIFDCLYTTAFRSILATNIPVVFVDFYQHPWTKTGLDLVKRRVGFIDAGYDKNNRPAIDWDALEHAIESAPSLCNNTDFFDYYYA